MATIYDYFQRALHRSPDPVAADPVVMEDHSVAFHLEAHGGIIDKAAYRCTSCVTLMAFCEHASELLVASEIARAVTLSSEQLLTLHPEVPAEQRNRADLVVRAVQQAAIQQRRTDA